MKKFILILILCFMATNVFAYENIFKHFWYNNGIVKQLYYKNYRVDTIFIETENKNYEFESRHWLKNEIKYLYIKNDILYINGESDFCVSFSKLVIAVMQNQEKDSDGKYFYVVRIEVK